MRNTEDNLATYIIFIIAIMSLVIAIYKDSLFAAFISGFFFSVIIERFLVLNRKAKENWRNPNETS